MNPSSFSGLTIGMDSAVLTAVLTPSLHAKQAVLAEMDALDLASNHVVAADNFIEPILRENPNRFTLFPIMKPKLFQKYKDHLSVFWVVEELILRKT